MLILAIESSQRTGGVALAGAGGETIVEPLRAQRGHDDDLVPAIDRLFRRAGAAPRELEAVAVSIGPGGFTGLRTAVSVTKMIALALGARVAAVPTAVVAAASCAAGAGSGPLIVGLASRNDRFWATTLERSEGEWCERDDAGGRLVDAAEFDPTGAAAVIADRYLPTAARARCAEAQVAVLEPRFDPWACLAAGRRRLDRGQVIDPLRLLPIYPRPPEAERLWKVRQAEAR